MEFFPETELDQHAAEAIARGLFAVAKVDGVHEREAALIGSFWLETGGGADGLGAIERAASVTPAELARSLRGAEARLFLKTAILLAYADGAVSAGERELLGRFATALQVAPADLAGLEDQVKEFLLGHVAHLANTDVVAEVAHKLDI